MVQYVHKQQMESPSTTLMQYIQVLEVFYVNRKYAPTVLGHCKNELAHFFTEQAAPFLPSLIPNTATMTTYGPMDPNKHPLTQAEAPKQKVLAS